LQPSSPSSMERRAFRWRSLAPLAARRNPTNGPAGRSVPTRRASNCRARGRLVARKRSCALHERLLRQRFSHCAPHQPRRRRGVHLESQGAPPPSRDHLRATRDIVLERRGRPTAHPLQRQPVRVPDDVQRCASCDRARSDGPHTRRSQRSRPCVDLCGVDPTERLPCSLAHLRAELELTELEELAVRIEVSFAFAATASRAARYDGSALSPSVCCCRPRI
jgi:hypothetical protein